MAPGSCSKYGVDLYSWRAMEINVLINKKKILVWPFCQPLDASLDFIKTKWVWSLHPLDSVTRGVLHYMVILNICFQIYAISSILAVILDFYWLKTIPILIITSYNESLFPKTYVQSQRKASYINYFQRYAISSILAAILDLQKSQTGVNSTPTGFCN